MFLGLEPPEKKRGGLVVRMQSSIADVMRSMINEDRADLPLVSLPLKVSSTEYPFGVFLL